MRKLVIVFLAVVLLLYTTAVADGWTCPNCGNDATENFCNLCGIANPSDEWICPQCKTDTKGNFCHNCGSPRPKGTAQEGSTSSAQAPSITQVPESNIQDQGILAGDDWIISKVYEYQFSSHYYYSVVFRHSKEIDQKTTVNFVFYDKDNKIIGAYDNFVGCTGHGYDYFAMGVNDAPFDHVDVSFRFEELKKTTNCMDGIKIQSSRVGDKIIVKAENTGDKPISACNFDILLFDEKGNVLVSRAGYFDIPDSEMQKGETIVTECKTYGMDFAYYELYYIAYNLGNK